MLPAVVGLAVIAWLAAQATARVKLILLYPMSVGLLGGYGIGVLCWWGGVRNRLATGVIGFVLVAAMMLAYFWLSFLNWQSRAAAEVAANLRLQPGGAAILEQLQSNQPADNPVEAELLAVYRERLHPPLDQYLRERVRLPALPWKVQAPWNFVIAGVEIFAAATAGAWLAAKVNEEDLPDEDATEPGDDPPGDQP